MQADGQYTGQWQGTDPAVVTASPAGVDGTRSMDPHDFYRTFAQTSPPHPGTTAASSATVTPTSANYTHAPSLVPVSRSFSRSPTRPQLRSVSGPASSTSHGLNSAKSNPAFLPSRQTGSVKDIATKFDQLPALSTQPAPGRTSQEKYRRKPVAGAGYVSKSPVNASKNETGMAKLQKRRPVPKSPTSKSPTTSFETNNSSFASNGTITSTRNQPHAAFSPKNPRSPTSPPKPDYSRSKPLFGSVTSDGQVTGIFDPSYQLPSLIPTPRRGSEGSISQHRSRSQSHNEWLPPSLSPPENKLKHKRSRSEMDAFSPQPAPSMPNLNAQSIPALYPTPPHSGTKQYARKHSADSRIPAYDFRMPSAPSDSSTANTSRSASALSNPPGRNRLSKSPTRKAEARKENNTTTTTLQTRRYNPTHITIPKSNQTLSARIVAPLPKTSPPLRSSRPRQTVSSATTAASRARAADRFQSPTSADRRRPSEQWLGRPYDQDKERNKKPIPKFSQVDFAERRKRIQKAMSQNLEDEQMRQSLVEPGDQPTQGVAAAAEMKTQDPEHQARNSVDQNEADILDRDTDNEMLDTGQVEDTVEGHSRGLSLDTTSVTDHADREPEPMTAGTEFEVDESPVLGHPTELKPPPRDQEGPLTDLPTLLTSATYQPPPSTKHVDPVPTIETTGAAEEEVQSPSILENVMRMRQRSASSASRTATDFEESPVAEDSPSDIEDKWGLGDGLGDRGSIKIMLDDDTGFVEPAVMPSNEPWLSVDAHYYSHSRHTSLEESSQGRSYETEALDFADEHQRRLHGMNGFTASPLDERRPQDLLPEDPQATPRKQDGKVNMLKPSGYAPPLTSAANDHIVAAMHHRSLDGLAPGVVSQIMDHYQSTGSLTPAMLEDMQKHLINMSPDLSKNGFSDAAMIQNLLNGILQGRDHEQAKMQDAGHTPDLLQPTAYTMPALTPDSPSNAAELTGTAVIYNAAHESEDNSVPDLDEQIRRAHEEWKRQHEGGGDTIAGADEEFQPPTPPPKDFGYSPRLSTGPNSAVLAPESASGLRISTGGRLDLPEIQTVGEGLDFNPGAEKPPASPSGVPPAPSHAPPPPPSPSIVALPAGLQEVPPIPASYSDRGSNEYSPRLRKALYGPSSASSRPSMDSQRSARREPPPLPNSSSMHSFAESQRKPSGENGAPSISKSSSPDPEQKRLIKRRHLIKEMVDTENTYYHDLKIIEDIYKATGEALLTPEDRKTLFGNTNDIERFSLRFFDALRRAVASIYVPPKKGWGSKRGSFSTTQSDGTGQTSVNSPDPVDDEKDRKTTVGQTFMDFKDELEQVYSIYLKNHDAANQRLAALQTTPAIKCWLDECHKNASDITSAWNLDSLLVKPTQRVLKYPLLLANLLEVTPKDHPDRKALEESVKESVELMKRIDEAKKRADLVDQIVNRKRKDSDVRSGLAKAFGRRTEKIKERVGVAEHFQDPTFDELAHKFGGHYIRLQICMRDVQDYLHRTDKVVDQFNAFVVALESFIDVSQSHLPEIESKWRKFAEAIKGLTQYALPEHKASVHKRIINPMLTAIKLHEGPQQAINKRKKRIVDYAKCKSLEKRGETPDKKTKEASDQYEALNDQMKIDLPKLYSLTAEFIQTCLKCFIEIQQHWHFTWERKLRPILDISQMPKSIEDIEKAFRAEFDFTHSPLLNLGICNGSTLNDASNFLSPTATVQGDSEQSSLKRPPSLSSEKRTMSFGNDGHNSPSLNSAQAKRFSGSFAYSSASTDAAPPSSGGRFRSNSSVSSRGTPMQTPVSMTGSSRPWSNSNATQSSSYSTSRPSTATARANTDGYLPRPSTDNARSPRPSSGATYFTAHQEPRDTQRFSGIFSSAMPPDSPLTRPSSPKVAPADMKVLFVSASLFEFNIDKERKEGGYPYLTYERGEVFDVVAQKGELWLAKNQDDPTNNLGWIWEQHFVILSHNT